MINLAISGANGRMGQALIKSLLEEKGIQLNSLLTRSKLETFTALFNSHLENVECVKYLQLITKPIDVIIDFSTPLVTLDVLKNCIDKNIKCVIGTTGFTESQKKIIEEAAKKILIILAPNTSVGLNLILKLIEITAKVLPQADTEIIEAHHKYKVDAPSGTALKMGEVIAKAKDLNFEHMSVFNRHNHAGIRQDNTIGFSCIRAGEIIGEHTALFALPNEKIEIKHTALDRNIFAKGALQAARWLAQQTAPGLYDMQDVLGLKNIN
ncbi:MAG: dihydrodipicolinate reductase [Francisellaceae bacterium]|nr:dihydrodipicolinate reductase [Francisellaceae bacterium]